MVLIFYFATPEADRWAWKVENHKHAQVAHSRETFSYYLDALADARARGYSDKPSFASVEKG